MATDPVSLFERAASHAATLIEAVRPADRTLPTPCAEWDVQALIDHMSGGTSYLLTAAGEPPAENPTAVETYRQAVARCVELLRRPGALDARCASPVGFEWSVGEAVAGTFMDQLVHSWDLAVATNQDAGLDPELAAACVEMFLPAMPELGRQAGLVGPAVPVPDEASAQARLLGAMGRHPE